MDNRLEILDLEKKTADLNKLYHLQEDKLLQLNSKRKVDEIRYKSDEKIITDELTALKSELKDYKNKLKRLREIELENDDNGHFRQFLEKEESNGNLSNIRMNLNEFFDRRCIEKVTSEMVEELKLFADRAIAAKQIDNKKKLKKISGF